MKLINKEKAMKTLHVLVIFFAVSLLYVSPASAENSKEGIQFTKGTWADIIRMAKKENKIIFADCYTTWCGPCKMLSKNIFPQKAVGDYFNANFINVKIDCEKGEGPALKNKFGVSAFPTMLFINADNEKVLHRVVGSVPAEKLIEEAENAPVEAKRAEKLAADYKKNKKNIKVTEDYLSYLIKISDPKANEVATHYLSLIPKTDWHKKDYFKIMSRYVNNPFSKEAGYFFKNKKSFIDTNGFQGEYFESGMYYSYAGDLADVKNKADFDRKKYDKLIKLMQTNGYDRIESIEDYTKRCLLVNVGDWAGYMDVIEKHFKEGLTKNAQYYAESGFNLLNRLKNCSDKAIFVRASALMDDVVASQLANPELNMFGLSIAYRDSYDYMKKAGITGNKLAVAKAISDLFDNINPKHRALLDKTYKEAQKAKEEGKTGGRSIPAMKMGGY